MDRIPIGTTPTLTLELAGVDLTQAKHVYMTAENRVKITKKDSELEITETTVGIPLTQAETLRLGKGTVYVKANWTYDNGARDASSSEIFRFTDNQLDRTVE